MSQRSSPHDPTYLTPPSESQKTGSWESEPTAGSPLSLAPQSFIGGYQILEPLGEGGMGQVFVAQHPRLGKRVAIKVLRPEYASHPSTLKRFYQEAQAASHIENPHIVQVFDFGDDGKRNFIVMELLNGADLAQARQRDGPFPLARVLSIVRQVGAGLAAAHDRAIVHRDLKPENIFLVKDEGQDYVKLLDFGLAKLSESRYQDVAKSQAGMFMGTPDYMAPEQVSGKVDARTDIYSLATLLYWMVAGELPFWSENLHEVLIQRATQPAPPLPLVAASGEQVPSRLRDLVAQALERDPERRPANVRELVRDLEAALAPAALLEPADRGASSPAEERLPSRGRPVVWLLAIGLCLVGLLTGWLLLDHHERTDDRGTAAAPRPPPLPAAPAPVPTPVVQPPLLPPLPVTPEKAPLGAAPRTTAPPAAKPPPRRSPRPEKARLGAKPDDDAIMPFE